MTPTLSELTMNGNPVKRLLRRSLFRTGATRPILWGPLRGYRYRVTEITGLSPLYSGAERATQSAFRRLVRPGSIVFDVGANWGLHTLYLSKLVGERGRVVALEPLPSAYQELCWHIDANRVGNAVPLGVAASAQSGEGLFLPGENPTTGQLVTEVPALSRTETLRVASRTIDSLVEELGLARVDLLKIDVEGAESAVLQGATETTRRHGPSFVIELHTPEQDRLVADWLLERGYTLHRLTGAPIPQPRRSWPDPEGVWGTILALPGGQS